VRPGDYLVREVAGESVIVVRDGDGRLRAFFNVCRHRGTRLCAADSGRFAGKIQCRYHGWTYSTCDGRLLGAPHMNEARWFDKNDHSLHGAAIAECEGFVFLNVDRSPPPFAAGFSPMRERFARFKLGGLRVMHSARYLVHANWKVIIQNYSECLHCPLVHPRLNSLLPHDSGGDDLVEGPFLGGWLDLVPPHQSVTLSGRPCARPLDPGLGDGERARARFYTLMPNMMIDIYPDYVSTYLLTPVTVDRTLVEFDMLFRAESAGDPAFDARDAIELSEMTNREDWETLALAQQGIASRRYQPGPYSPLEGMTLAWDREYYRQMGRSR